MNGSATNRRFSTAATMTVTLDTTAPEISIVSGLLFDGLSVQIVNEDAETAGLITGENNG